MKIALGSDHAAWQIKDKIKSLLQHKGWDAIDYGTKSGDSCDYPDFAASVSHAVAQGEADLGILLCGSGIGMSIAANKVKGIRAALCVNEEMAKLSRLHNNANILCLGVRTFPDNWEKIVETWLNTSFEGGRHQNRIDKIHNLESCSPHTKP
ncbi:MAG: ribose 5-phosphate isomerase B [Candidatus Brocadiae bacterium]|nr:ribose 5-phosphate isomerase B [Candidatus Brocadiia bacterium]